MHNEYGWKGTREGASPVHGLKHWGQSLVSVFTIDEQNSRSQGRPDRCRRDASATTRSSRKTSACCDKR